MSVCRSYQTASRNSCLIVLGDVSVSTESTSTHEFASQFGLDIFLYAKNTHNYCEYRVARATVYLNEAATGH